jgi:hypothetical protein
MAVKIFVEGIADEKFLRDYILAKYNKAVGNENIILTNGWTNIKSGKSDGERIRNEFIKNTDNAGINLLIFDADNNFSERLNEIMGWKIKNNLEFEIFLWPNNSTNGEFEIVLENIINPLNSPVFECWDQYENCLKTKSVQGRVNPLTTPAKKTKIYGYLEALLGDSKSQKKKIKERNRDYTNVQHWNLDSSYLDPLKNFLDKFYNL